MPRYDRDPKYLHPLLRRNLASFITLITAELSRELSARPVSTHRSPADQFDLFKKGRRFIDGQWRVTDRNKVVTHKDGLIKLSRHNYLPSTALDFGLYTSRGTYLQTGPYRVIGNVARRLNFDWGGDWQGFRDMPHVEIPASRMFQGSIKKDVALQWQKYLRYAGTYTKAMDGIFARYSEDALAKETGSRERTMQAWACLFENYGPVEDLPNE